MNTKYFLILMIVNMVSLVGTAQENDYRLFDGPIVKISEVKTNTDRSDFGPAVVRDTLYFTSYSDKILGVPDNRLRKNAFYDLYRAKIDKDGNTISKREPIPEFLTKYHDGPVSFCEKTGELFVTQSDNVAAAEATKRATKDTIKLRIVIAKQVRGKWTSIVDFPYNDPAYSVGHPAISITGDTLVFSSDKKGGFGETDLYYTIRRDGKWATPINMGAEYNTTGKEEFSFLTHNENGGTFLLFASTGRFGLGGLDLYYTRFVMSNPKIEHFDPPLNTKSDDFAMVIPPNAEFGFMTSNRNGEGNDDIYKFNFKRYLIPPFVGLNSPVKELYVFNRRTLNPISSALVQSCDKQVYLSDQIGLVDMLTKTNYDCKVTATKTGYGEVSKVLVSKVLKKGEIHRDTIWMEPVIGKKIILKNIYYDYDKWDILPDAAKELDQLVSFMNENPESKVLLGSHTDSRGDDLYNLKLSQNRAESAVNYVISHGISADRITGTGFGETQLLNRCRNGVECTPPEHRQNRRTEIFIPQYGKAQDVPQTEGEYAGKKDDGKFRVTNNLKFSHTATPATGKPNKATPATTESKAIAPEIEPSSSQKAIKKSTLSKITQEAVKPNMKPSVVKNSSSSTPKAGELTTGECYLVFRSFQTKAFAEKYIRDNKNENPGLQVIGEVKPFRVGLKMESYEAAKAAKVRFAGKHADCWILR
jgi:outer membrane protein OmpA-like peptidoglycan-associated protein